MTSFLATIKRGLIVPHPATAGQTAVFLSRFKEDELVRVTVEKEGRKRSPAQNRRYWSVLVPAFASWAGYQDFPEEAEKIGITPKDSAHNTLKALLLPRIKISLPDGSRVEVLPSTASLTTAQMADLQDRAERFLNDQGIFLPAEENA